MWQMLCLPMFDVLYVGALHGQPKQPRKWRPRPLEARAPLLGAAFLVATMPRRGWRRTPGGGRVQYCGAVRNQRARENMHGPHAPYRAEEKAFWRGWHAQRRLRDEEADEPGRGREGAAKAPHEHGGARSTAGSRAPWRHESGEAPRHPAEDDARSDGRGPPPRKTRNAAQGSDRKTVSRRHQSTTFAGEAFVSDSEEEARPPTRWVPARAAAPSKPEEVELLKDRISALLKRNDKLRFYARHS